jgi:3-dehydroquinate synthase
VSQFAAAGSPIRVEAGLSAALEAQLPPGTHRVAVITDSNVGPLHAAAVCDGLRQADPVLLTMPAGEAHKTRETWAALSDQLLDAGLGRDSLIVALGGGVVGDVAGFVAATYLRGIPVIQVPTSLVAMIDAAIGGKTGLDVPAGKNLVGAFHPPTLVAIDPPLLATLPADELRSGLAEAIKHGVIRDAAYFASLAEQGALLTQPSAAGSAAMQALIERSVAIKCAVVSADPREAGERKILNFGHTLGHAIEAESAYALRHGEAVAIGMVLEAALGEALGVTESGTAAAIAALLSRVGLPTSTGFDADRLLARTRSDKKKAAGRVEYALPAGIGHFAQWSRAVPDADVLAVLAAYRG